MTVPHAAMGQHQMVIGSSGSGKDEPDEADLGRLVLRHPPRTLRAGKAASAAGGAGLQGSPDSRVMAERTRRLLHAVRAGRVAIWPDEASVSLWSLPPLSSRSRCSR